VWTLWACLSGAAAVWTYSALRGSGREAWSSAGAVLLLLAFLYVPLAARGRLAERFEQLPPTLDGEAYMAGAGHATHGSPLPLGDDLRAIEWLRGHVEGSPVILEGTSGLYDWGARYSIYTGLPTVIGWDWHQKQQRWEYRDEVDARVQDVLQMYGTATPEGRLALLRRYGVRYVIVGPLERAVYPTAGLATLDAMAGRGAGGARRGGYDSGGVRIYEVLG